MTLRLPLRDRLAMGRAHRKHMPRTAQAACDASGRHRDPLSLLFDSEKDRIPELIRTKHERMSESPFGFFRGAVPIMAADLALSGNSGIFTQLCGDAHVRNLGAFAAPDGRVVFDINDFDETIPGPFEWDLKRMATSLVLAGEYAGAKRAACRDATFAFVSRYRTAIHLLARIPVLELARYQVHRLHTIRPVSHILRVAERATPLHNRDMLTVASDPAADSRRSGRNATRRLFRSDHPNLSRVDPEQEQSVLNSLATYAETLQPERQHFLAQYAPADVAFKVVGTGSVGLRDYCVYLEGNGTRDPLFLQIKQAVHSAYTPYLGDAPLPTHQGRRVVQGQRAMQLQSDPFLGWTTIGSDDYLVRQLNDHKAGLDLDALKAGLAAYAALCGETLARGHARAGDPGLIAGYIGTSDRFDRAIGAFAQAYARQTKDDWHGLVRYLATEQQSSRTKSHGSRERRQRSSQ